MSELRLLFWNVGRTAAVGTVGELVGEHQPDLVILAECAVAEATVVEHINSASVRHYNLTINLSRRLKFFIAAPSERLESLHDGLDVAVRRYVPFLGHDVLIVAVHLPSKLHLQDHDQAMLTMRLANLVTEWEDRIGHTRTVLIGDLNMNPFEHGVVSSEGLHGVMSRTIAQRRARTVRGEARRYFYNPMWSMLGDLSPGPPGSYFYYDSGPTAYFWNTFDQVLLRPDIAEHFQPGDVKVLASVADRELILPTTDGDDYVSDHLPVLATIRVYGDANSDDQESVG